MVIWSMFEMQRGLEAQARHIHTAAQDGAARVPAPVLTTRRDFLATFFLSSAAVVSECIVRVAQDSSSRVAQGSRKAVPR